MHKSLCRQVWEQTTSWKIYLGTGPVQSGRHLRRKSIWAKVENPRWDYSHGRHVCKVETAVCRRVQKGFLLPESCVMWRDSQMSMTWWVLKVPKRIGKALWTSELNNGAWYKRKVLSLRREEASACFCRCWGGEVEAFTAKVDHWVHADLHWSEAPKKTERGIAVVIPVEKEEISVWEELPVQWSLK